jgi:hypothetical protein
VDELVERKRNEKDDPYESMEQDVELIEIREVRPQPHIKPADQLVENDRGDEEQKQV